MTVIFGKGGFRNFSFSPGYIHFLIFLHCILFFTYDFCFK